MWKERQRSQIGGESVYLLIDYSGPSSLPVSDHINWAENDVNFQQSYTPTAWDTWKEIYKILLESE